MTGEVNYEAWAVDMCSLLDAIEAALSDDDTARARVLVAGRHRIAEAQGLNVVWMGQQPATIQ
jgi:hypothetical protein